MEGQAQGTGTEKQAAKPREQTAQEKELTARVENAQKIGYQAFLVKIMGGQDVTARDTHRALLGLGYLFDQEGKRHEAVLKNVSTILGVVRDQMAQLMTRQEILAENHKRLYAAIFEHVEYAEKYEATGWWKRRKMAEPVLKMPKLIELPDLKEPAAEAAPAPKAEAPRSSSGEAAPAPKEGA